VRAGKIAGIQIIISNWFIALIGLFCFVGLAGKLACLFLVLVFHEAAHVLAAGALGYRVREIRLMPFGGVADLEDAFRMNPLEELITAAAGPAANLVIAALLGMCGYGQSGPGSFNSWWGLFYEANFHLGLFNLLPGLPLDGGRILRSIFALHGNYHAATRTVLRLGKALAAALTGAVVYNLLVNSQMNITLAAASLLLVMTANAERRAIAFSILRGLAARKADLSGGGVLPASYVAATPDSNVRDVIKAFAANRYHIVAIVGKDWRVKDVVTESEVWEAAAVHGWHSKIRQLLK